MEDDAPPGVPEWVVTYGDMMSLLLTFFIMLVSLSEVKAESRYRAVLDSLQKYIGYQAAPVSPEGQNFPLNSLNATREVLGSHSKEDPGRGGVRQQSPEGIDLYVSKIREGEAVAVTRPVLFDQFSSEILPQAAEQLREAARVLAGKPNKLEIRAHTGAKPLPAGHPARNLRRLSWLRARAVASFLESAGVLSDRMRLTALGAIEPLPAAGDGSQPQSDRVEILISDLFQEETIGPRENSRP
ncbi:MAG: OmpA family protein [Planctomycetaceae bacterium]|nr:OmpA family protein [Planctomycetaceae bacterium]